MEELKAGAMWTGDGWVLVLAQSFGELLKMTHSPLITDVTMRAMRSGAQVGLAAFRTACDEEARIWLLERSEDEQEALRVRLYNMPIG